MAIVGNEGEQAGGEDVQADGAPGNAELAFDDGDESLPWLESDDDYEERGIDTGRIAGFAVVGLLVVGLLVGAIWWATNGHRSGEVVADGSTIEAPEGPYKTKPEKPGGKTFEGTGNTSFAVAEGQSREGKIVDQAPRKPAETASPTAAPAATEAAQAAGVGVQVGAYSSRAAAEKGWATLQGQFSPLQGVKHRVVEGRADIGTVYRLQAVAGDLAGANSLCAALRSAGGACQVKP